MRSQMDGMDSSTSSLHQLDVDYGQCCYRQVRGSHERSNVVRIHCKRGGNDTAAVSCHRNESWLKEIEVIQHLLYFTLLILWRKMELDYCNAEDFD